jgi:hypothetical protein
LLLFFLLVCSYQKQVLLERKNMEEEALGCGDDYMDEIPFDELFDDDFNFGSTMAMGEEEHNNNDFLHQQVSNT